MSLKQKEEEESNFNGRYPYQDKDLYGKSSNKDNPAEEDKNEHKPVPFKCNICGLNEICHYFGKKPPFVRGQMKYVEDTFVMMDPFCPREKGRPNFLTIGGLCRYCENSVCVECSVFYAKRICKDCATLHFDDYPDEIQARLKKLSEH